MEGLELKVIARIRNDFPEKFGVPRQSGLVEELRARIIFEPEYKNRDAVRGLEGFSHIWLLWGFSLARREGWSPTVRPPRLGGNRRVGVFATRSPFRPNPVGLSSVRLIKVDADAHGGPVLHVSGADLVDGTPIYDIKPYLAYTDSHPEALGGFTDGLEGRELAVIWPEEVRETLPEETAKAITAVLAQDPRPSYQSDPGRVYGMDFAGFGVRFRVEGQKLLVISVSKAGM